MHRVHASYTLIIVFVLAFMAAGLKIHLSVHTTLLGYKIGKLKNEELELLQHKSQLAAQLARMTTKEALLRMAHSSTAAPEH